MRLVNHALHDGIVTSITWHQVKTAKNRSLVTNVTSRPTKGMIRYERHCGNCHQAAVLKPNSIWFGFSQGLKAVGR
jgi:uncharacterized protein YbcV (DUF1398 family)